MGYVAAKGGRYAILNAEKLVDYFRLKGRTLPLNVKTIEEQFRLACDKVMSEGSLYAPELAALALKQAEGDIIEASFLLRAYRSTLPRIGYSEPVDTEEMFILRRISSAFKDIPGGQILGPTRDYIQRLLRFELLDEKKEKKYKSFSHIKEGKLVQKVPKLVNLLREEGLLPKPKVEKDEEPYDITRCALVFPLPRSGVLQAMARGEEGGMMAIAYSSMRGYGDTHPTLAELRVGYVFLKIKHPLTGKTVKVGEILATEAEVIAGKPTQAGEEVPQFTLGYGLVFGHNERKAISMAMLDITMRVQEPKHPAESQEFVICHIDSIESSGFTAHWKLPHYVTFQSDLDRLRKIQKEKNLKIKVKSKK
ncbi:MAG: carbon-phosphorus lyase complex subunit PhnI [Candidatus Omnitrophica bacterium]|nr:carbon-phosphorus lyase complex subunit PhnI [Candidatus Omnitrophota bacterium]